MRYCAIDLERVHHSHIGVLLEGYRGRYLYRGPSGQLYQVEARYIDSMCGGHMLYVYPATDYTIEIAKRDGLEEFTGFDVSVARPKSERPNSLAASMSYGIVLVCVEAVAEDHKVWEALLRWGLVRCRYENTTTDFAHHSLANGNTVFLCLQHWLDNNLHDGGADCCRYCGSRDIDYDDGYCDNCDCYSNVAPPCDDEYHPGDRSGDECYPDVGYSYDDYQRMGTGGANFYYWSRRPRGRSYDGLHELVRTLFASGHFSWAFLSSCVGDPPARTPEVMTLLDKNQEILAKKYGVDILRPSGLGMNPSEGYHYIDSIVAYVSDRDKLKKALS